LERKEVSLCDEIEEMRKVLVKEGGKGRAGAHLKQTVHHA